MSDAFAHSFYANSNNWQDQSVTLNSWNIVFFLVRSLCRGDNLLDLHKKLRNSQLTSNFVRALFFYQPYLLRLREQEIR